MEELWIVHRDARARAALGRLAGGDVSPRLGDPADGAFERAGPSPVVVLGAAGDLEAELAFASRQLVRRPGARWVVVRDSARPAGEVERLFEGLGAACLPWPPSAEALRRCIAAAHRGPVPLLSRRTREALDLRFARHFADLLPLEGLERALVDPDAPLLVRGETGSGRLLLARVVHARRADPDDLFLQVPCAAETRPEAIAAWAAAGRSQAAPLTLCLEEADRLAPAVQRTLRGWLELGEPLASLRARRVRWMATVGEPGRHPGRALDPGLAERLAGVEIWLPPLRERPEAIGVFVEATCAAWGSSHGVAPPVFSEEALMALRAWPWPANLRELEAVLVRTLAAGPAQPIVPEALRFEAGAAEPAGAPGPEPAGEEAPPSAEETEAALAPLFGDEAEVLASEEPAPPAAEGAVVRPEPAEAAVLGAHAAEAPAPGPRAETGAAAPPGEEPSLPLLRRVARSFSHEVRNPLVAIRTFASLLPERFEDPEFRSRFREQVGSDVGRIEALMELLGRFAALGPARPEPVDVSGLLEELLEARRPAIQARRLLVLQELDSARPLVRGDAARLRFVFEALLDRALVWVPERADLFVASKYHPAGPAGGPSVRVLLRFYSPSSVRGARVALDAQAEADVSLRDTALEILLAEHLVQAEGGTLRVDTAEGDETVVLLDLPAAA